jgi:hypothetical protein
MPIIDERGAKSISGWFKDKQDTQHTITIGGDEHPFIIKVSNDTELASMKVIFMRNGIKFKVDESKISSN